MISVLQMERWSLRGFSLPSSCARQESEKGFEPRSGGLQGTSLHRHATVPHAAPPYRTFTSQRKRRNHKSVPCSSAHQAIFDSPPSKNNNDHFKTPSFNQSILHPDHFTQTHKSKACTRNSRFLVTLLVTSKQRKVRRGHLHLSGEAD